MGRGGKKRRKEERRGEERGREIAEHDSKWLQK